MRALTGASKAAARGPRVVSCGVAGRVDAAASVLPASLPQAAAPLTTMPPDVKRFQEAKAAYASEVAAIRKQYIAEVQQKFEEEQAKKRAEAARIKEAKRKRLLAKAEERKKNLARFLQAQREQRERFEKYLAAMQKVRDSYVAEVRAKQANLLQALTTESSLWITEANLDDKITEELFAVAGRTTFSPTRRSRDWQYMALPRVPDFSAYHEEDLFDEKEDMHFLTDKSPWRAGEGPAIDIPEGHEYYAAGPAERVPRKAGPAGVEEDAPAGPEDVNLYFEDAAYRPSLLAAMYQGAYDDFQPSQVPDNEIEHIRELAERYEEQLLTILGKQSPGEALEGGEGRGGGGKKNTARGNFDPKAFAHELGGGSKKES